jgi:hypothetical protein
MLNKKKLHDDFLPVLHNLPSNYFVSFVNNCHFRKDISECHICSQLRANHQVICNNRVSKSQQWTMAVHPGTNGPYCDRSAFCQSQILVGIFRFLCSILSTIVCPFQPFFFWPLYCLSSYLRLRIVPLLQIVQSHRWRFG